MDLPNIKCVLDVLLITLKTMGNWVIIRYYVVRSTSRLVDANFNTRESEENQEMQGVADTLHRNCASCACFAERQSSVRGSLLSADARVALSLLADTAIEFSTCHVRVAAWLARS